MKPPLGMFYAKCNKFRPRKTCRCTSVPLDRGVNIGNGLYILRSMERLLMKLALYFRQKIFQFVSSLRCELAPRVNIICADDDEVDEAANVNGQASSPTHCRWRRREPG